MWVGQPLTAEDRWGAPLKKAGWCQGSFVPSSRQQQKIILLVLRIDNLYDDAIIILLKIDSHKMGNFLVANFLL